MQESFAVELKNLRFFANHGHYAAEAVLGNEFEVNLMVTFIPSTPQHLALEQTVDYEVVYNIVKKHLSNTTALLENITRSIADDIGQEYAFIHEIVVSIEKLNPPIPGFTGKAGVNYKRTLK